MTVRTNISTAVEFKLRKTKVIVSTNSSDSSPSEKKNESKSVVVVHTVLRGD